MANVNGQVMQKAAASLVERARYGDQNAMGMLAMIGESAKQGSDRAKKAAELVQRYIERNPVKSAWFNGGSTAQNGGFATDAFSGSFGAEAAETAKAQLAMAMRKATPLVCSAVRLANGPPIDDQCPVVVAMAGHWTEEEMKQFEYGVEHWRETSAAPSPVICGRVVGYALAIQETRKPDSDLREWGPAVAWELGY